MSVTLRGGITSFLADVRMPKWFSLFPYTTLFRSEPTKVRIGNNASANMIAIFPLSLRRNRDRSPRYRCPDSTATLQTQNRSEEHTSELQSRLHLVCRLLLEKKKKV